MATLYVSLHRPIVERAGHGDDCSVRPGYALCGRGFDLILVAIDVLSDPRAVQWLREVALCRLLPGGRIEIEP